MSSLEGTRAPTHDNGEVKDVFPHFKVRAKELSDIFVGHL